MYHSFLCFSVSVSVSVSLLKYEMMTHLYMESIHIDRAFVFPNSLLSSMGFPEEIAFRFTTCSEWTEMYSQVHFVYRDLARGKSVRPRNGDQLSINIDKTRSTPNVQLDQNKVNADSQLYSLCMGTMCPRMHVPVHAISTGH